MVAEGERAKAKALGLTYYFTGQPCSRGHISKRITANGVCHECFLEDKQRRRASRPGYRTRAEMDTEKAKPTRKCSACGKEFPPTSEHFVVLKKKQPSGTITFGLSRECRQCRNKRYQPYYEEHRDDIKKRATEDHRKRRERSEVRGQERLYGREHMRAKLADPIEREKHNERGRDWRKANPDRVKQFKHEQRAEKLRRFLIRMARIRRATPPWADKKQIDAIYALADYLTEKIGIPYEVDHIYPLAHRDLCGMHIPANLRVITRAENQRKGNRFPDERRPALHLVAS